MSLLAYNTLPAERIRGCIFAEQFYSATDIVLNGGIVSSSPYISMDGCRFDGTDDKIAYPLVSSIKTVAFWINLATTTEDLITLNTASSISITVSGGVISANNWTAPTIYVDGVATSSITIGWHYVVITTATAFNAINFVVGYVVTYGEFTIRDLKVWNNTLSSVEALSYFRRRMFNYSERALVNFPYRLMDHDPTNNLALDRSGNGRNATLVGTTKLNGQHGYYFGGGGVYQDLHLLLDNLIGLTNKVTVTTVFSFGIYSGLAYVMPLVGKWNTVAGPTYGRSWFFGIQVGLNNFCGGFSKTGSDYIARQGVVELKYGIIYPVVFTLDASLITNGLDVYTDTFSENLIGWASSGLPDAINSNNADTRIGSLEAYGGQPRYLYNGNIYEMCVYNEILNRTQIHDYIYRAKKRFNEI